MYGLGVRVAAGVAMLSKERIDGIAALQAESAALRDRIAGVETQAEDAEREACLAREEVLALRDQLAAAQRDQQDLRTIRARLARVQIRG